MKKYDKDKIIWEIKTILEYYSHEVYALKYAKLLLNKVDENEKITLSSDEIKNVLFDRNTINKIIFDSLRRLNADFKGISFDNVPISGIRFNGLENVVINIDNVPDKNLSNTSFTGVKLIGSLDNAIINNTDFTGYIGELVLNPQTLKDKTIEGSKLSGIFIDGSFDGIDISRTNFTGVKGNVRINPQNVKDKELHGINFADTCLVGPFNQNTKSYEEPSFKGCTINDCEFKGLKRKITIDLDEIEVSVFPKLSLCDLTDVLVKGTATSNYLPRHPVNEDGSILFEDVFDDLYGSYYEDVNGNTVYIHLFESRVWNKDTNKWKYIQRKKESNLQIKVKYLENKKKKLLTQLKPNKKK